MNEMLYSSKVEDITMENRRAISDYERGYLLGKEEGRNEVLASFVKKNLAQKNEDDYIVVQLVSIFDLSKSEAKAFLKEVKLKKQQR